MCYGMKLSKRRLALATLLALVSMATVRAEEPAPAEPAAVEFVPFLEVRVNQPEVALADFKAFVDHAVPMVSAMVMGEINPILVHSNNLAGVDGKRPVHAVVFLPKKAFNVTREGAKQINAEPLVVQFIPLADEKVYLDKVGEEVEEVVADGDYKKVVQEGMGTDLFMKVAGKFAIFSNTKLGVDKGVGIADKLAAADAESKETSSLVMEIRPSELFKETGLDVEANRANATKLLVSLLKEGVREMTRGTPFRGFSISEEDGKQIAETLFAIGSQAKALQMSAKFNKDACQLSYGIVALPDSDLAKQVNGMKALDLKSLEGLPGGAKICVAGGALEPILVKMANRLYAQLPEEPKQMVTPVMDLIKAAEGQSFASYAGVDATGKLQSAGEINFKEGTDVAATLKALVALQTKIAADMKANQDLYAEIVTGETAENDGWQVATWTVTLKSENEEIQQQLAMGAMFLANPQYTAVLTKGTRVVFASAADAEGAIKAAKAYAARTTGLGLKADYQKWLETEAKDRNATAVVLFDAYPLVKRGLSQFMPMPEMQKLAEQTVGTLNPLSAAIYAKDGTAQAELRIEAEIIKQWVAFVMQAQQMMRPQGGGMPDDGGNMPPPVPAENGDF